MPARLRYAVGHESADPGVSDTVGVFVALLGFAVTVGVLTKFIKISSRVQVSLLLQGLTIPLLIRHAEVGERESDEVAE